MYLIVSFKAQGFDADKVCFTYLFTFVSLALCVICRYLLHIQNHIDGLLCFLLQFLWFEELYLGL